MSDLIVTTIAVPDIIVGTLFAGGLNLAIIPHLKINEFLTWNKLVFPWMVVVLTAAFILSGLVYFFPAKAFQLFAPGINLSKISNLPVIMNFVSISIPMAAVAIIFSLVLQVRGRFLVNGLGPIFTNLSVIMGIYISFSVANPTILIVKSVAIGFLMRMLLYLAFIEEKQNTVLYNQRLLPTVESIRSFWIGFRSLLLILLIPIILRAMSSFYAEGSLTIVSYSLKFYEVPVGLFLASVNMVLFPKFCEFYAEGNFSKVQSYTKNSLEILFLGAVSIILIFYLLKNSVIEHIFARMGIQTEDAVNILNLTTFFLFALPFGAGASLLTSYFNSIEKEKTVLKSVAISFLIFLASALFFRRYPTVTLLSISFIAFNTTFFFQLFHKANLVPQNIPMFLNINRFLLGVFLLTVWLAKLYLLYKANSHNIFTDIIMSCAVFLAFFYFLIKTQKDKLQNTINKPGMGK